MQINNKFFAQFKCLVNMMFPQRNYAAFNTLRFTLLCFVEVANALVIN